MIEKKTKIVCTIGPSSWDPEVMRQMIESGMNCARVNGAFADPEELDKVAKLVRDVSNDVALMVDVKGPEVRMNKFSQVKSIKPGDEIIIGNSSNDEIYPANYPNLYTYVQPGQRIVIGDGDVELLVKEIRGDQMVCEVVYGEIFKPGKALNLPGCEYTSEVLTEKDKENLEHAIRTGWDMVSASFIQDRESAQKVKDFITERGSEMKLIAKIEDEDGVLNIDEILEVVDGVMIARGGLGVELGLERVPIVQRILTKKCNDLGKPVITATQMVESMIENPRPTRAEISDVATSILLGSDSVMLSGESSAGHYPVAAVKALASTALEIEKFLEPHILEAHALDTSETDAYTKAAAELCINLEDEITAVIAVTKSGNTAKLLGRHTITQPIYAFCKSDMLVRQLSISKGVHQAFQFDGLTHETYDRDYAVRKIKELALEKGVVKQGQKVLLIAKRHSSSYYFPGIFEIIEV